MPNRSARARQPADRATARVQAASERIKKRRQKSALLLWGTAVAFCIVGSGICYGYYVVSKPKPAPTFKDTRPATAAQRKIDWDERERVWRGKQRTLRQTGQKGFNPEIRQLVWAILENARDHLRGLRINESHRRYAGLYREKLRFDRAEWHALMSNLPARVWEDRK